MADLFTVHRQVFNEMVVTIRLRGQQFWESKETEVVVDNVNTKFRLIYGTGSIIYGSGDYLIEGGVTLYLQKNVNNSGWTNVVNWTQSIRMEEDPFAIYNTSKSFVNYPNFTCSAEWNFGSGQQQKSNYDLLNDTSANDIQVTELSGSGWINFNIERNAVENTEPYLIRNYETSETVTVYMLPSQPYALKRLNMACKIQYSGSTPRVYCRSDRLYFYDFNTNGSLYSKASGELMIQGGTSQGGEVSLSISSIGDISDYYKSCGNVDPTTETQTPLSEYVTCQHW